ncbi:MAG: bifunctional hydroxymethylpyrimidine kinase/phosphomethylpyrimidine kinase [Alphaproteobacteria bacterium]|nr:bifunctional hydroxymethylpyrimidine kinase/phosphomethylpyrimidine kinase [Alphaproteobacteria bacterium]MDE2493717.1 bifunctional hydroxymethylpyrimidine kinase/phosphomethylpyrimidine kinase [Alphaproteobacteria bacterium]
MAAARPARLLIIAGSDSSGGAGIQADIKTAAAFGVYAMTAVTAVTVQNTKGVHGVHPVPPKIVKDQIVACLTDIGADAIKTGMLVNAAIAKIVAATLAEFALGIPLVVDPVMVSTSGALLLKGDAEKVLKKHLLPLATLVTPNIPEAKRLTGIRSASRADVRMATTLLRDMGAKAALIKGGHSTQATVDDVLAWEMGEDVFAFPRIKTRHTHGTGCTLATAIACGLAKGLPLPVAVGYAREYVQAAIETAPGLGKGYGPLNHAAKWR